MARQKGNTSTPEELSQQRFTEYSTPETGIIREKDGPSTSHNRENQISRKGDPIKTPVIGLADIDESIQYYFENVIKPTVREKGSQIPVPLLCGVPERWSSMQRDGAMRDKNGKMQTPLLVYKRTSIEKNRAMGNKLDANNPHNFQIYETKYSNRNIYDRFSVLTNRKPESEFHIIAIPDYVNITYSCTLYTNFIEQSNKIIENINYASDAYWGDSSRFQFRAMIDSFTPSIEISEKEDRISKTDFEIKLLGYIIPEGIQAQLQNFKRIYSKSRISFDVQAI